MVEGNSFLNICCRLLIHFSLVMTFINVGKLGISEKQRQKILEMKEQRRRERIQQQQQSKPGQSSVSFRWVMIRDVEL